MSQIIKVTGVVLETLKRRSLPSATAEVANVSMRIGTVVEGTLVQGTTNPSETWIKLTKVDNEVITDDEYSAYWYIDEKSRVVEGEIPDPVNFKELQVTAGISSEGRLVIEINDPNRFPIEAVIVNKAMVYSESKF